MRFFIILFTVLLGSSSLFAMDPPPKPEQLKFLQNSGATFIKEAILFDIERKLVKSPLYLELQRLESPEAYDFLLLFYEAFNCPIAEEKKKHEIANLARILKICLPEADGGEELLNFGYSLYRPLKEAIEEKKDVWGPLNQIAIDVLHNLPGNMGPIEEIGRGYQALMQEQHKKSEKLPRKKSTRSFKNLINNKAKEGEPKAKKKEKISKDKKRKSIETKVSK